MAKKLLLNTDDKVAIVNTGENATAFRTGIGENIDISNSAVDEQEAELIIESTEIGNKIEILSNGKNLFDEETNLYNVSIGGTNNLTWKTNSGENRLSVKLDCKPNTTYSISVTGGNRFNIYYSNIDFDASKSKTLTGFLGSSKTITTPYDAKILCVYLNLNDDKNSVKDIQIEESPIKTQYEPFKLNKTQILLDKNITKTNIKLYKNGHVFINNEDGTENTTITKTTHLVEVEE